MRREFIVNLSLVVLLAFCFLLPAQLAAEENQQNAALGNLRSNYPGVMVYGDNQQISRLYGKPFSSGTTPENSAANFIADYSGIFGVSLVDLKPISNLADGRHIQPVMYLRETGEYKFTLVCYTQYKNDIPVFGADLRLLVRNERDYPLVLAASSLKNLGDFEPDASAFAYPALAQSAAKSFNAEFNNFSEPELTIWAGINDEAVAQPILAMKIIADNGKQGAIDYMKWLFLVDLQTGEILYSEDLIINVDVTGTVSGMATQGLGADICDEEVPMPMPYARVSIGSNNVYADSLGNFVIPNDDSSEVTITSYIRGQWFTVNNQNGGNSRIDTTVFPPGPIEILHNSENISQYNRAEVNGYIQANVVRDFTLKYNPSYPGLQQNGFSVNVNLNDNCNAYYDGYSINFFTSGGGCPNTAFSTVVHHEYGHHLVALAGSGQGQYGEGMGDVMGVLITDDPGLAYGFFNNCSQPLRNADNYMQYPCTGEIHDCGQLISGCVWSTRNELMANYPDEYIDIIANLAVNAMLVHVGNLIDPSITIDYLTLDDDDGNIDNGTPHYPEICAGFGDHNMDCPELRLIGFEYPDGHPDFIAPEGGETLNVEVYSVTENPAPGTGIFHYNYGSGWFETPMEIVSPNIYNAIFPEIDCGLEISYYFSAETDQGNTVTDPNDAPTTTYSTFSAYGFVTLFADDFETDQGWTVENSPGLSDGAWNRGVPVGGGDRGDPPTDYDGSGQCYLTDNVPGNSDVDGGTTYLISPLFDLTDENAIVYYALWYTNFAGDNPYNDYFRVWVSDDDGGSWQLVETFGPASASGWTEHSFLVSDYITPNDQVKVRFEVSDLGEGSIVEAGIDAFFIKNIDCEPTAISDNTDGANLPKEFKLVGSYPNPFNASVTIRYNLPQTSRVNLEVYDILGQKVATLVNQKQPAGYHQVTWNAGDKASGMYFYKLETDGFSDSKKMILLK